MTTVTISESPITVAATEEVVTVSVSSQEVSVSVTEGASVDHDHDDDYEPALGNPAADGYVLSSTAAGVRSWIELMSGGGAEFPWQPDSDGAHSILQNAAGTVNLLSIDTTNRDLILYRTGGLRPDANTSAWPLAQDASGDTLLELNTTTGAVTQYADTSYGVPVWIGRARFSKMQFSGEWSAGIEAANYYNGTVGPEIELTKYRGQVIGSPTSAQAGDEAGIIKFWAGWPYKRMAATIQAITTASGRGKLILGVGNGSIWYNPVITLTENREVVINGTLPTSDPAVAGQLWNDGGTLKVSAG